MKPQTLFLSNQLDPWINYQPGKAMGHLLLTWINFKPSMDKVITSIIKCGIKLLIHSQTSTVQPLKFGNGKVISSHTLLCMWLLIHAGIKVNPRWWKGPSCLQLSPYRDRQNSRQESDHGSTGSSSIKSCAWDFYTHPYTCNTDSRMLFKYWKYDVYSMIMIYLWSVWLNICI